MFFPYLQCFCVCRRFLYDVYNRQKPWPHASFKIKFTLHIYRVMIPGTYTYAGLLFPVMMKVLHRPQHLGGRGKCVKQLAWKREMRVAMWLIQSFEGLMRKDQNSPRKTEFYFQLPFGQASTSTLSWVSHLSAHPADFRSISPLGPMSQTLKIHLSLCI